MRFDFALFAETAEQDDEADVTDMSPRDRRIAMVFQNYALYPHLSVHKNIVFPLKAQRIETGLHQQKKRRPLSEVLHWEQF